MSCMRKSTINVNKCVVLTVMGEITQKTRFKFQNVFIMQRIFASINCIYTIAYLLPFSHVQRNINIILGSCTSAYCANVFN